MVHTFGVLYLWIESVLYGTFVFQKCEYIIFAGVCDSSPVETTGVYLLT
jgi:hypothetical protein